MTINNKIHVVHITQYLEIGGLESFIVEFCRKMDTTVFTASVLCLNGYDSVYQKALEKCGVTVHLIKKSHTYDFLFLLRAAAFLKNIQADIVHTHGGCFFYSSLIARCARVKRLVYTVHGMPVTSGLQARVEEYVTCAMTDRIVAVSDEIADDLGSRQAVAAQKIDVIINGIDPEKYRPIEDPKDMAACKAAYGLPAGKKIIGSVGRLEAVKNYPLLLNAFAELIRIGRDELHLVLVGSGREDTELKRVADELKIEDNVTFLGMQYDVQNIYPLFDVFVLSSLTEGTSLSLLEAQSCGVPAVVTDVGGNSGIVRNGVNGFLSPSGDHVAMAAHLEYILTNDTARFEMKQRARAEIMDRFDITAMVKKYQDIYVSSVDQTATGTVAAAMKSYDIRIS